MISERSGERSSLRSKHNRTEIELFFKKMFFYIILNERGDKNMYMWKFSWGIIMKNKKI